MIRFIGDVHGKIDKLLPLVHPTATTIQVGDFGFGFVPIPELPDNLFILRGNHDNPGLMAQYPKTLTQSGVFYTDLKTLYYVAGAYSVDCMERISGVSWWPDEQLGYIDLLDAIYYARRTEPDIIFTHDCPDFIYGHKSITSSALTQLFDGWHPKLWVFGHHHQSFNQVIENTRFVGLAELEVFDVG